VAAGGLSPTVDQTWPRRKPPQRPHGAFGQDSHLLVRSPQIFTSQVRARLSGPGEPGVFVSIAI